MSNTIAPNINSQHACEWTAESGISESITKLNLKSIKEKKRNCRVIKLEQLSRESRLVCQFCRFRDRKTERIRTI